MAKAVALLLCLAARALASSGDVWVAVPAATGHSGGSATQVHAAVHAADMCPFGSSSGSENVTTFCAAGVAAPPPPLVATTPAGAGPAPSTIVPSAAAAAAAVTPQMRLGGDGRLYKCCDALDCSPSSPAYAGNCDVLRPDCATTGCPPEEIAFPPSLPQDPSCKTWKPVEEECKCGCYCVCIYTSAQYGRRVKWLT